MRASSSSCTEFFGGLADDFFQDKLKGPFLPAPEQEFLTSSKLRPQETNRKAKIKG